MDQLIVHCPHCQRMLRGSPEAAGRKVRCASCASHFVIPEQREEVIEETISCWIEQDVDDVLSSRDQEIEQRLIPTLGRDREQPEPSKPTAERDLPERLRARIGGRLARGAQKPGGMDYELRKSAEQPPADGAGSAQREASAGEPGKAPEPAEAAGDAQQEDYPQQLLVSEPEPRLVVRSCEPAGVRFAFDSQWLAHPGFRASMPARCVFTGNTDRSQLIARPLVFADRMRSHERSRTSGESLAGRHENRMIGDRTARQIDHLMGQLEGMPHPFNESMPYYVSNACAHLYLHCQTRDRPGEEGVTCEVLVPDLPTALEWLGRVNGVCGREYELLEREGESLHGPAWEALSEQARRRISGWCKMDPREIMHLYLPDADMARRDEGMAGLVLTDRRLVFCKYHHRGQIALDAEQAVILARCEDKFAHLTLMVDHERSRMIKAHLSQLDTLVQTLEQLQAHLKLVRT